MMEAAMQQDKGRKNGDDENGDEGNGDEGDEVRVEVTVPRREQEYKEGPPASRTRDESSHHSSPQPSDVQQAPRHMQMPPLGQPKAAQREITGSAPRRVDVPMHVTRHPEPRGRPRQTEGDE
jgi:hypothetical protein